MCGIVAIVGPGNAAVGPQLYDALSVLQHRGQDAAGIATDDHGRLALRKDNGLVADVFKQKHMDKLRARSASATAATPPPAAPATPRPSPST